MPNDALPNAPGTGGRVRYPPQSDPAYFFSGTLFFGCSILLPLRKRGLIGVKSGRVADGWNGQARHTESAPMETRTDVIAPLLADLPADVLARVQAGALTRRVPRGVTLLSQGQPAGALYVLLEGQVGLLAKAEPDGDGRPAEQTMVELLDAGEVFLAAAVLTGRPCLMGAVTLSPCRLLEIPRDVLMTELRASPDLSLAMLATMARHFRMLVREVKDLKLKTASQRLALYLLGLTRRWRGSVILRLPHNKSVIAARIGVRPETLSRAFAHLRGHGLAVDGHSVAIADLNGLCRYCHEGAEVI